MKRGSGLQVNPEAYREWQRRSNQAALERQRQKPLRALTRTGKRRRNDGPWRHEVMAVRGPWCRAVADGACAGRLHAHHIIHRSLQGPSVVENGMVLCDYHHREVHSYRIRIPQDWLDVDQVDWLWSQRHAWWEPAGGVAGAHRKLFAPIREETEQ